MVDGRGTRLDRGRGFGLSRSAGAALYAVSVVVTVLAAPVGATAQADTTDTARPFVQGGVYDKPYLTRLLGRTAIGGYAEAHARFERTEGITDDAGFNLERWNLFTSTEVSDFVRIGAELEFEDGGEEIILEYAAIDLDVHPRLTLRAGAVLVPLGRFNLAHDSPQNPFTDRPPVSTELLGVALTDAGVGALGLVPFGEDGRVTYELYAVNGFDEGVIEESTDGTRIPLGEQASGDANDSPAVVGRIAVSPEIGWELGVSAHHGRYNRFMADGEEIDEPRDLTIGVLDFEATLADVTVRGEGALAEIEIPPTLTGVAASRQRGLFVEALRPFGRGWIRSMDRSYLTAKVRLDLVDFDADTDGDSLVQGTVGVNFRPTPDTAVKLDFVRGFERDAFDNREDFVRYLFSVATYF